MGLCNSACEAGGAGPPCLLCNKKGLCHAALFGWVPAGMLLGAWRF